MHGHLRRLAIRCRCRPKPSENRHQRPVNPTEFEYRKDGCVGHPRRLARENNVISKCHAAKMRSYFRARTAYHCMKGSKSFAVIPDFLNIVICNLPALTLALNTCRNMGKISYSRSSIDKTWHSRL